MCIRDRAYTLLERDQNGNVIGALRYVVSLTLVDRQVWILVGVMLLFGCLLYTSTARLMTEAEKGDTCWLSCSSVPSKSEIYKVVMV